MKKKSVFVLSVIVLGIFSLAGCSKKDNKIHIRVWETKNGVD